MDNFRCYSESFLFVNRNFNIDRESANFVLEFCADFVAHKTCYISTKCLCVVHRHAVNIQ